MFFRARLVPRRRCLFVVFRGPFSSRCSSCSSSFVPLRGNGGHPLRTVKTNGISLIFEVGQGGRIARKRSEMTRKPP